MRAMIKQHTDKNQMSERPILSDMPIRTALIIDDDRQVRHVLSRLLANQGYGVTEASTGQEGVVSFTRSRPAAVLLDLRMPGMDGMTVLKELKKLDATVPIIIITAHGDIPAAVEAIKLGAYDFIAKPPEYANLMTMLRRAIEAGDLLRTVHQLSAEVSSSIEHVLGASVPIKAIAGQIHKVAHSDFSVMIQGETGTGKSFIARMIHDLGQRSSGPFVMVDVGSIPETLMESELFGHEKGAFTGADRRKSGYFESANGGTLFIDELQNISPAMQGKLLAAVEERRVRPLGSTQPVDVDIRIICAMNEDLTALVQNGRIREDLFYRLCEFCITLPPLRERVEDIRFYARRFMDEAAEELERHRVEFSPEAAALILAHRWPGNIRELKNVVRRAALLAEGDIIEPRHLQFLFCQESHAVALQAADAGEQLFQLAEIEKKTVLHALEFAGGNKTHAAALLSIDYKTLLRKLKSYGI
jgi:DNA-binding NtrC family response regulator